MRDKKLFWLDKIKKLFTVSFKEDTKRDTSLVDEELTREDIHVDLSPNFEKETGVLKQTIEISKDTIVIGNKMFSNNFELNSLTIPSHVDRIGNYAFWNCVNLTSIFIANGLYRIGEGAFSGCTKLVSITLPDSIMEIGPNAFWNCIYNHRTTKTNQKYPSVNL